MPKLKFRVKAQLKISKQNYTSIFATFSTKIIKEIKINWSILRYKSMKFSR